MTTTLSAARPGAGDPDEVHHEITTAGLTKAFGGVVAVNGLDLAVRTGEVYGLLGPNGAGKTTTIGMLTTRVVPTGGRARVAGLDVTRRPAAVKSRIGTWPRASGWR